MQERQYLFREYGHFPKEFLKKLGSKKFNTHFIQKFNEITERDSLQSLI